MLKTLQNAFKIKEIREKLLYTFFMLVVIRLGSQLPIPGVDTKFFAEVQNTATASEEAVDTLQVMVRLLVKVTKARKHVPAQQDRDLKAARCLYTDVSRREDSQIETLRQSLVSM